MKNLIYFFIFLKFINIAYSSIQIWNFEKSSINLFPDGKKSYEKTIYKYSEYNLQAALRKEITKNNYITEVNYIKMLDNEGEKQTSWEDIDLSHFIDGVGHFICPKGGNNLYQYANKDYTQIKPNDHSMGRNGELICYYFLYNNGYNKIMLQGFLNIEAGANFYGKDMNTYKSNKYAWTGRLIDTVIYDFLLSDNLYQNSNGEKKFGAVLSLADNKLIFRYITIRLNDNSFSIEQLESCKKEIDYKSTYMNAYFDRNTNISYFMVCNGTKSFRSGYSNNPIVLQDHEVEINIVTNSTSPFEFSDKAEIHTLKMIRNTRFAFYNISDGGIKYRGIIDLKLNQIVFNTDKDISTFKPLSLYSLLAITDSNTNAYEICAIKNKGECANQCPSNKRLVIDSAKGNFCELICEDKQYISSDDKCINSCDTTINIIMGKYCGLCKDLDTDNPYKIYNESKCLKDKPNSTYYYDEDKKILGRCSANCQKCSMKDKCDLCLDGSYIENNKCSKCHDNCTTCENIQKCTSCINSMYLHEGKCLDNCPEGFYPGNKNCFKCHDNCETCTRGVEKRNGVENQNCDSCKKDLYLIKVNGYDKNCTNYCPNNTILIEGKYCILKEKEKKQQKENSFILNIFKIIIGACLFLFSIYIYIKLCRNKKSDYEIIGEISSELSDNIIPK